MAARAAARGGSGPAFAPYGATALKVYDTAKGPCSEPLEFLSRLYNGEWRRVLLPEADLGQHLRPMVRRRSRSMTPQRDLVRSRWNSCRAFIMANGGACCCPRRIWASIC